MSWYGITMVLIGAGYAACESAIAALDQIEYPNSVLPFSKPSDMCDLPSGPPSSFEGSNLSKLQLLAEAIIVGVVVANCFCSKPQATRLSDRTERLTEESYGEILNRLILGDEQLANVREFFTSGFDSKSSEWPLFKQHNEDIEFIGRQKQELEKANDREEKESIIRNLQDYLLQPATDVTLLILHIRAKDDLHWFFLEHDFHFYIQDHDLAVRASIGEDSEKPESSSSPLSIMAALCTAIIKGLITDELIHSLNGDYTKSTAANKKSRAEVQFLFL